ncbi:hypothetical protein [Actinophytocola sp.]|uniref:hypothetical protein n=1 Tax=Actinophytocola sp. TaxID=1872138 RepID=UPI002ED68D8A
MAQPKPEYQQLVRALAESQWGEPSVVVHMGDVGPAFDVPGRRKDGTVTGTKLVRRFFWNLFRGTIGGLVSLVLSVAGGGAASVFTRSGKVTGPANAQALGLVDAAKAARGAWLVASPSHLAVVDTGPVFYDPQDNPPPRIVWHAEKPHLPRIAPGGRRISWPDGSVFEFTFSAKELRSE